MSAPTPIHKSMANEFEDGLILNPSVLENLVNGNMPQKAELEKESLRLQITARSQRSQGLKCRLYQLRKKKKKKTRWVASNFSIWH